MIPNCFTLMFILTQGFIALTSPYSFLLTRRAAVVTSSSIATTLRGSTISTTSIMSSSVTKTDQKDESSSSSSKLTSIRPYYQLVVDEKGETSVVKRDFHDVEKVGYAAAPQLVTKLDPAFAKPVQEGGIIFTQLSGENPWHHCPSPQIVVCLTGGWYVKTTNGDQVELRVGDVLYQDNTEDHPMAKEGTKRAMHFSGSLDGKPCDQMIVQLDLTKGIVGNSKDAPPPL